MRVAFCASDKDHERRLAQAFAQGVRTGGDVCEVCDGKGLPDADAVAMFGVKSRKLYYAVQNAGMIPIMLDKGYTRYKAQPGGYRYYRVAVGAHHPTRYLMDRTHSRNRLVATDWTPEPWRDSGAHIVIAGSSAKYHDFYGMEDPTTYAEGIVSDLRWVTDRPIIYRPKPSWRDARPVKGTTYSGADEGLASVLVGAWALITHGSNACVEAAIAGVPSIILGNGVAAPISSRSLAEIENPRICAHGERLQWLANLSYCQWTLAEFASGEAWRHMRRLI